MGNAVSSRNKHWQRRNIVGVGFSATEIENRASLSAWCHEGRTKLICTGRELTALPWDLTLSPHLEHLDFSDNQLHALDDSIGTLKVILSLP